MERGPGGQGGRGDSLDALADRVIGCILKVQRKLGPGFLEKIYQRALRIELAACGLEVELEKEIPIYYDGQLVGKHFLDLVVENTMILELKTVEALTIAHYSQVRSYLKSSGIAMAILANYSGHKVDFRRLDGSHKPIPLSPSSPRSPLHEPTTAETAGENSGARINTGQ